MLRVTYANPLFASIYKIFRLTKIEILTKNGIMVFEKKRGNKKMSNRKKTKVNNRSGGKKKLTAKQDKFCREYLVDLNATQAAIRAGYSAKTAAVAASRLLINVNIQERIQTKQNKLAEKTEITQEYIVNNLKKVAERSMQAEPVLDKNGEETGEYQFNATGANKSLELLGKHLGLFSEKIDHNHSGEIKTTVNIVRFGSNNNAAEKGRK